MGKRDKKQRIDTSSSDAGGLNDAFAGLSSTGLPSGPEKVKEPEPEPTKPARLGRVVLRRETAHRGGKTVVVVSDFDASISAADIESFSRDLRKHCGCGGTVRGREIEVQGDQPAKVCEKLESMGFRVAGVRK